jgi:hypothetical protein
MSKLEVDTIDTKTGTNSLTIKQNDTAAITIDTSQNVGIGTSSPSRKLHVHDSASPYIKLTNSNTGTTTNDGFDIFINSTGHATLLQRENLNMNFYTNDTERMRIDSSGKVAIGSTSPNRQFNVHSTGIPCARFQREQGDNALRTHLEFIREGNSVGEIQCTNTSTSYATSSDHRLKENVIDLADATTRVKQLQPKRFNFIADANTTVDGFLAHEVSSIVPEAITGTHNEVEVWKEGEELPEGVSVGDNKLDDEGNTIPVYQGIDQSKLVPLLTASLQEAIAKIETLETRITALENA